MQDLSPGHLVEEYVGSNAVGHLTASQEERDRAAELVGERVDFRGAPAARAADCLGEFPPFPPEAQRWAFTAELSINTCAGGPPAEARAWKMLSQTPLAAQRTKRL
jgi:hypothetical protein